MLRSARKIATDQLLDIRRAIPDAGEGGKYVRRQRQVQLPASSIGRQWRSAEAHDCSS